MAVKHGLSARLAEAELGALEADPPAWLVQSRANRTGKPVWVTLVCAVCGFTESARPKKWWPEFTYLSCDFHDIDELPAPAPGLFRDEMDGVGSRFVGVIDSPT